MAIHIEVNPAEREERSVRRMKYCTWPHERKGSCYHEFFRGKWDKETFWRSDSLLLDDDTLCSVPDFINALSAVLPDYDPYGETTVTKDRWDTIGKFVSSKSSEAQEMYQEIDMWAAEVFKSEGCFTILGL